MAYEFRWNEWNVGHVGKHGVEPEEAEHAVEHPGRGFPRFDGDGRFRVWGQTASGRYLQVVYVFSPPGTLYVIHARDLTVREKRRLRRGRR